MELDRQALAEEIRPSCHFLLHDAVVLLSLRFGVESLPRQGATQKVHKHIGERLEVVSTGLLNTEMCVDRRVSSCADKILSLPVRNVEERLGVAEHLCETEVDNVDLVIAIPDATSDRVRQDVLAAIECGERCNAGMLSAWEEFLNPSVITSEATMEGLPSSSRGMPRSRSNVKNERMHRNFGAEIRFPFRSLFCRLERWAKATGRGVQPKFLKELPLAREVRACATWSPTSMQG